MLEFGFNLLEDSKLRDHISNMLFSSCYSSRLTVRSAFQSKKSSYSAARLEETVDVLALMWDDFPDVFKKFVDNEKKVRGTC